MMQFSACLLVLLGLFWPEVAGVTSKPLNLRMCTRNRTIAVQVLASEEPSDTSCKCTANNVEAAAHGGAREDYEQTPGIGAHKLHTEAVSWNDARRACLEEGGHLAVINSKGEEAVLLEMLKRDGKSIRSAVNQEQAHIGAHDFFQEGEWLTVLGEPLAATGYAEWTTKWWGPQPDNYQGQNCAALVVHGGMDDVNCADKLAFFCELHIGCSAA